MRTEAPAARAIAPPRLIAWELTRRCLLNCSHCRAGGGRQDPDGELTTDECFRVLENLVSFAHPVLILTGGEPLLRPDVFEIASRAAELGLRVALASCGVRLDAETVAAIRDSGIRRLSVSIDGAEPATHDSFRGAEGAFEAALRGIAAARDGGLDFQINTTISKHNVEELPAILDLAVRLGASVFNPFLLVPTGRATDLRESQLSPEECERVLHWLGEQSVAARIPVRVTCAPHYQRVLAETGTPAPERGSAGCLGGKSFAFISHRGAVQICGFLDVECGDLRQEDYDFRAVWHESELLRQIRAVDGYHGACGVCGYRTACGGCRARAYAMTGDYLGEEPYCVHEPPGATRSRERAPRPLDKTDKTLLSRVQTGLPCVPRPFDLLADGLGISPSDVIARMGLLKAEGYIRRLGGVFDSRRLGYVSTLVAGRVPPDRLDEVAEVVNRHPGVTHNYAREHEFNLWFTLAETSREAIERTLDALRRRTGIPNFISLPAVKRYKVRVHFDLSGDGEPETAGDSGPVEKVSISDLEKEIVRRLQDDLPLVLEPFADLAAGIGITQEELLDRIAALRRTGVLRRLSAVVNHRRLGYGANGLAVFTVPDGRIDEVGVELSGFAEVSHCLRRSPTEGWSHNLFTMVHGQSRDEVREFVSNAASRHGIAEHEVLFSTVEHKKQSMRYFEGGDINPEDLFDG